MSALGVVGAGGFGTALASVVARGGREVVLWSTSQDVVDEINRERSNRARLPGVELAPSLRATADAAELAEKARLVVVAVSSADVRDRAQRLGQVLDGRHMLVHAIGATAGPDDVRVSELLAAETPVRRPNTSGSMNQAVTKSSVRNSASVCTVSVQPGKVANAIDAGISTDNNVPTYGTKRSTAVKPPHNAAYGTPIQ